MGNIDQGDAFGSQSANQFDEPFLFANAQRGGWLVKNDETGIDRETFRDLNQLALSGRKICNESVRIDFETDLREQPGGAFTQVLSVNQRQVFPSRQTRQQ